MQHINTVSLIDHENLACGLTRTFAPSDSERVKLKKRVHHALMALTDGQLGHAVVGSSCAGYSLLENPKCFPSSHQVFEKGKDGAERALLDYLETHFEDFTIDTLIIGSGDGAFVPTAQKWIDRGTEVVVIAQSQSASPELLAVASRVLLIPASWQFDFAA
jgi:hypothetical protein